MPEIRTDRMVSSPSTVTGRTAITPVTTTERTTYKRDRISNESTEDRPGATGAVAEDVSAKLLCIVCSVTMYCLLSHLVAVH